MKRSKGKNGELKMGGGADREASVKQFPALRAFMRSYLHQDFGEEYGSVGEAVRAFCEDANRAEITAVATEWKAFLKLNDGKTLNEINNLLSTQLGSAWNASAVNDLREMTQTFDTCVSGQA
jgi:hypothetical protein